MVIDFHTHTFPDKIAAAALKKMQSDCHSATFSNGTVFALSSSSKDAGISYSVVLPVATNPLKIASINDVSINLDRKDGLIYFGCAHPDAENWKQELERISEAGIRGIKIHPIYQNTDINDIRYLRIISRAAELGLITVMHSGYDIGFPGVVRCSPEMTVKMLSQVNGAKVVLAHMGGWRCWDCDMEKLAETSVFIDTSFSLGRITDINDGYYSPDELELLGEERFCEIVRLFGADRVLFGTDSPWASQSEEIAKIRILPLNESEKIAILGENAGKLLGI